MVNSKIIGDIHLQHEFALQKRSLEDIDANRQLSYLRRKALNHINNLIFKITSNIKDQTGFIYDETGFTALSNYRYEGREIVFDVNRVLRNDDKFVIDESPKEKEIEFYTEYKSVLDRLGKLEQKRKGLLPPPNDKIVTFGGETQKSILEGIKKNQGYYRLYINMKADSFVKTYGREGIFKLVNLLNTLSSYNDIESLTEYIKSLNMPYDEAQELLTWAALYDIRAERILDSITRERMTSYLYEHGEYPFSEDLVNQDYNNQDNIRRR